MEEKNTIKRFLDAGLQLGRDTLDYFKNNEEDIDLFIEKFSKLKEKPNIITIETIQKLLHNQPFNMKTTNVLSKRKDVSINSLVNLMTDRYNLLKDILEEKKELKNLVSINKISPNTKEFSIICMVRSLENKTIVAEDTTGELTLNLSSIDDTILQDDILGFLCEQKEGTVFVKKTIWPDIPLKRKIKRPEKKIICIFIGSKIKKIDVNGNNAAIFAIGPERKLKCIPPYERVIFLSEDLEPEEKSVHTLPLVIKLNGVNVVILSAKLIQKYKKHWKEPVEVVKNLLKRRNIDPIQKITQNYAISSILTTPPDIIAFPNDVENILNYKGTTIISIPKNGGYYIDLSTREVKKI
jgi:DNA polymerase II small subunit/DNA polymerase delta subunit B